MASGGSNRLMDVETTAEYLGIRKRTLQDSYIKWGLTYIKVGRRVMFRERHIEAWLEENTVNG